MKWNHLLDSCGIRGAIQLRRTQTPRNQDREQAIDAQVQNIKIVTELPPIWPERYHIIAESGRQVERIRYEQKLTPMEVVPIEVGSYGTGHLSGLSPSSAVVLAPGVEWTKNHYYYELMEFVLARFSSKKGHLCRLVEPDSTSLESQTLLDRYLTMCGNNSMSGWPSDTDMKNFFHNLKGPKGRPGV